jgi:putative Holliday junction resolvase
MPADTGDTIRLGLDFGEKTIGVAVSDKAGRIALGLETLRREKPEALRANINRLGEIIKAYGIGEIVLGRPLSKDGTESRRSILTEEFKGKLERNFKHVPVVLWDERFSTAAVGRTFEGSLSRYEARVDEMAAVYILQGYLDFKNKKAEALMEEEMKIITMCDEVGEESSFLVLSARELNDSSYMLVQEYIPEDEDEDDSEDEEEEFAEVMFFKNISGEGDEMTFELVDDGHDDFDAMLELFAEDMEALEVIMEEDEDFEESETGE